MRKNKTIWKTLFFIFLCIGTIWIIRENNSFNYYTTKGEIFGTTYHIKYKNNKRLDAEIRKELLKVDNALSIYNPNSIISKVNRNDTVELNPMFVHVFNQAKKISKETNGAFDFTIAPLVNAWGFGFKKAAMVNKTMIDSIRQFVGYHLIKIEKNKVIKSDSRTMIDCNAIAKGYSVDVIARLMQKFQISNYMIEIGGELAIKGLNSKGKIWRIGINKPIDDISNKNNDVQTIINISNIAIATSGNYRNFYYKNNKKYAHTISPTTGYPIQNSILSATVFTDNCCSADAYATAFMVMGFEKTKEFLATHHNLEVILILAGENNDYITWYSPSLKHKI